ncbi:MAG TPA: hypothetical protein VGS19_00885 [Streptosporangiaceae bacterium]|nr:hypothetical protein [Streptosporangiaceae bacterium]
MSPRIPSACQNLLTRQEGVIARWQAIGTGLALQEIDVHLRRGRWQPLYRGVYAAHTGVPPRAALLWAAVLRAGPTAGLSHHSAAELDGLADRPSDSVHVVVSSTKRIVVSDGQRSAHAPPIVVHYSCRLGESLHPCRRPRRTRIEETALDLAETARTLDEALEWLTKACTRRLSTTDLLRSAMAARAKFRWRAELELSLAEIDEGVHSALERRYVRRVETPHGLPRATRQARSTLGSRTRYLDNHYGHFGVAVELDGQAAHPAEARWRDIHRDNSSAAAGIITLRYNWADVTARPCQVAAEVAAVLTARGWTHQLQPCSPHCGSRPS